MTTFAIQTDKLKKVFGKGKKAVSAVNGLNLEVEAGQVYGFLGPNGAGKSTTIRMLLDLIYPTSGTAYLYGQPAHTAHEVIFERVGAMVEGAMFYNFMSGRRNLEVLAYAGGYYDSQRIDSLLAEMAMVDRADQRVGEYSTGMKQRIGIAAALLNDPDLIILDEPTNGLDPIGIREIRSFIRKLADEDGKTVFLSSHLLHEIEQVCDRVAIINHGLLIQKGAVAELLADQVALQLEVEPSEKAMQILSEHWKVTTDEKKMIRVRATHDDTPHIIRKLTEHDIDIYQVTTERRTLEDYFISVTDEDNNHA